MSLNQLDGIELEIDNSHKEYKLPENKRVRVVKEVNAFGDHGFRPLVINSIDDSVCVGRNFTGTLNIQPVVKLPPVPLELSDQVL
jgi:hypothetical protein